MAIKNFITLENLSTYDSLLKQYISDEDAKSIKAAALNGKKLELYTVEVPGANDDPKFSITLPFTQQEIISEDGKSLVCNEVSGGGAKFENVDGVWSFTGVNSGGENGITGQLYTVKKNAQNKYEGTRLNMTLNGFYYTRKDNSTYDSGDELATLKDIQEVTSDDKTVYTTETTGGANDNFAKRYTIYQGADGSSESPVAAEKLIDIDVLRDMVVSEGRVVNITLSNGKLWDGETDVTEVIIGSETPTDDDAGKYIRLTISDSNNSKVYIKAMDLVDIYTGGTTSDGTVTIDENNEITITLSEESIDKEKLDPEVQEALDLADSALQPDDVDSVSTEDIQNLFS